MDVLSYRKGKNFFSHGFHVSPLRYSIHASGVSGGSVSLMCLRASSSKTSPVGVSLLIINLRLVKLFFLIPCFSNSTRPLNASSIKIQPLNPLDMQSFQNDRESGLFGISVVLIVVFLFSTIALILVRIGIFRIAMPRFQWVDWFTLHEWINLHFRLSINSRSFTSSNKHATLFQNSEIFMNKLNI
ncbi:hypothetical protein BpHYR1_002967 [Brachionus plicatilis]|uniref:Uncharacterized protein n=1 Tax=Brachionus plicatilis TaxID=10195 RepID=A0A3M7P444_BRAPC|nr:hypothetical protein BpHYR1_002967 [Brachionus plicatilis]